MTMWEDLGPQVVTSLSTANGAIDSTKNSMDNLVNTKYDTLSGALGSLWRTIQTDMLQPIGNMLIPYVEKAIAKVKDFTKWWNSLGSTTQKNIVKFAAIAAAVGPILLVFGKLTIGVGNFITNIGKIAGAVKRLTGGANLIKKFATGAVGSFKKVSGIVKTVITVFGALKGPIIAAMPWILGISAIAVLVYQNWDRIKEAFKNAGDAIGNFVSWAGEKLNVAKEVFFGFVGYIGNQWAAAFNAVLDGVKGFVSSWVDGIRGFLDGMKQMFGGLTDFLKGVFTGNWKLAFEGLKNIVAGAFSGMVSLVKAPVNAIISLVNRAIEGINSISLDIPDWVPFAGGSHLGFNIPKIPTLAVGTDNWKGGIAQISERGGEIVDLPKGTRVYPHDESVRMAREDVKRSVYFTIAKLADHIIVREEADIDRIAEAIVKKVEKAQYNMA